MFEELRQIVDETIQLYVKEGRALPPPTSGRDCANKMQHVAYRSPQRTLRPAARGPSGGRGAEAAGRPHHAPLSADIPRGESTIIWIMKTKSHR